MVQSILVDWTPELSQLFSEDLIYIYVNGLSTTLLGGTIINLILQTRLRQSGIQ